MRNLKASDPLGMILSHTKTVQMATNTDILNKSVMCFQKPSKLQLK